MQSPLPCSLQDRHPGTSTAHCETAPSERAPFESMALISLFVHIWLAVLCIPAYCLPVLPRPTSVAEWFSTALLERGAATTTRLASLGRRHRKCKPENVRFVFPLGLHCVSRLQPPESGKHGIPVFTKYFCTYRCTSRSTAAPLK